MHALKGSAVDSPFDAHDLLEMHAWLAGLGPEAFLPAVDGVEPVPNRPRGPLLDWLLDPENRVAASTIVGTQLATSLATRGRAVLTGLGGILPGLVAVDAVAGYQVLRRTAAAVPPPATRDLADTLLTLALAEANDAAPQAGDEIETLRSHDRLVCLLDALAALDFPADARTRMFLALSQNLASSLVHTLVVPSALFPSLAAEGAEVLAEGTDNALGALLHGALIRPRGRAEFFEACRQVLDAGLETALPVLGRVARVLEAADPSTRALESLVRAALLPALEKAAQKGPGPAKRVPADADVSTLRLLSVVAPGLPEPHRTALCDTIIRLAGQRLRSAQVGTLDADAFVEAVVSASVLHADPERPSAEVRRMLLDTAGSLRVRLFAAERPPEALFDVSMAFEAVAASLGNEFRRRQSLASALSSVLPIVCDLSTPREATTSWVD
jgi:hypothetical protein